MSVMHAPAPVASPSTGCRLVSVDGRALPFRGGELYVDARGGLARVVLRQRFDNPYAEPLRVTYQVPLPSDAAVSGYAFELGDERIVGEIDTKGRARERFEEAIVDGRTAALLEQDRSSLFTQEVGNLPPGATVVCELVLDQPLVWSGAAGGWEWRFPTVVAPRFMGAQGRVPDRSRVTVDVAPSGTDARMTLALAVRDALVGPVSSPSHDVHVLSGPITEVGLSSEAGAALDRDIVVRWPVAGHAPGATLDLARAAADRAVSAETCGLLTLVPPTVPGTPVARDLVVLLDTSGSMGGRPLAQAKAVTRALIETLGERDQLQLVEFSTRPRAWKGGAVAATGRHKAAAIAWVDGLRAGGGTQMKDGILAALATLRSEAQRQVVLVTDGLIGFEHEITRAILKRLPRGSRVHTLGIGSGTNRTLLTSAARAGGGEEAIIGLDEDPAEAARALVAATAAPQVVDVTVEGTALVSVAHHRPPDLMATRPVRLALRLRPEGGTLRVTGHTASGSWTEELQVPAQPPGAGSPAVITLVGRERVADTELRAAVGESVHAEIERLGLDYRISTRRTSWVAVSQQVTVDPTQPTRQERVPQALPYGMSAEGVGLRAAGPALQAKPMRSAMMAPAAPMPTGAGGAPPQARGRRSRPVPKKRRKGGILGAIRDAFGGGGSGEEEKSEMAPPPPPAAPRAELPPMFDDVADMDDEFLADEPVALAEEGEEPEEAYAFIRDVLELVFAVRLLRGGRLVLGIVVPSEGLEWRLPVSPVLVQLKDGRTLQVEVDAKVCTAPGALPGGSSLRLVLRGSDLPMAAGDIAGITLTSGDIQLRLVP